jgi:hypothetical protein
MRVQVYSSKTNKWTAAPSMTTKRTNHGSVLYQVHAVCDFVNNGCRKDADSHFADTRHVRDVSHLKPFGPGKTAEIPRMRAGATITLQWLQP